MGMVINTRRRSFVSRRRKSSTRR